MTLLRGCSAHAVRAGAAASGRSELALCAGMGLRQLSSASAACCKLAGALTA